MKDAKVIYTTIFTLIFIWCVQKDSYIYPIISSANAITKDVVSAYKKLAKSFMISKKYSQAIVNYKHALSLTPDDSKLYCKCADALKEIDHLEEAIKYYNKALQLEPHNVNIRFHLANSLVLVDKPYDALHHYKIILAEHPYLHDVLYNYGFALKKIGCIQDAIDIYNQVLTIEPHYKHAHFSRGLSYLMLGDFVQGWPDYEWRENTHKKIILPEEKLWLGTQDLNNKTILLVAEQGLGDTLQFIRYAQYLKENYDVRITCQVQSRLMSILSLCPYIDTLISQKEDLNYVSCDYYIQLLSLPYRCNTTRENVPHAVPYLYSDNSLKNMWKEKLAHDNNFKIGICWHGNAQYANKNLQRTVASKSITPNHFQPLSQLPGISLYSLQQLDGLQPLNILSFKINEFKEDIDSAHGCFMDTAAIMHNLDLIITVDTSVAHLAGGLGLPVWVILPYPADWRWLINTAFTPWYPTMRLFRQSTFGDWQEVFKEVVKQLELIVHNNV